MATEIIEGTVAPATPLRSKRGYDVYDPLVITGADGTKRELRKTGAGGEVAAALRRGGKGRFYLSKNAGMTGIHGVRLDDGTSAYSKFHNFELIFLIGMVAGLFMLVIGFVEPDSFMITPVVIGAALAVAYFIFRSGRIAARTEFEDEGKTT